MRTIRRIGQWAWWLVLQGLGYTLGITGLAVYWIELAFDIISGVLLGFADWFADLADDLRFRMKEEDKEKADAKTE